MFATPFGVFRAEKLLAEGRQHAAHVARGGIARLDETAQTAVPFADRTDRTDELDEIAAVESAVDEP